MDDELFDIPRERAARPADGRERAARPRVQRPDRAQVALRAIDLDGTLAADHRARVVWSFVEALDLRPLYERIRAVEGEPGRPPIDPAILTALWLYATLEGVGSARALDRLCGEHDAYRWLCGGVSVNHHTLADFRVAHGAFFDGLLTDWVAALVADGTVTLERVAQDGMRVRASAGRSSFRTRDTLERAHAEAEAQVAALRAELDADPAATSRRVAAARERAARELAERTRRALERVDELQRRRDKRSYHDRTGKPASASTTDPEVSRMTFPDHGVNPADNVQFATDTRTGLVVGLAVDDELDSRHLGPMIDQLRSRYGRPPLEHLVDQGYRNFADLAHVTGCGTTVYMPVNKPRHGYPRDPHQPRRRDRPEIAEWRRRMGTPAAQAIYRDRAPVAEGTNAHARNRGLRAFRVRSRAKAHAVVVWFALAHNLLRTSNLRTAAQPA